MLLKYSPETTLKEPFTSFVNHWNTLMNRAVQYVNDNKGYQYYMHTISKDPETKVAFLLLFIKYQSMGNIVDNAETK